jgi:RHS repeat-associated protein
LISRQKDTFCSTTISAAASDSSGRTTDSFKYDPFGRRIYKSSSSATSVYAYDGDNLVEETSSAGGVVARYEQNQSIDEPLAMLRSSATSYFHADGLGSVTSLSNAAGSIANTYTYDSFGKLTASTGSLVNPFQYTARELDPETNLYYYRARYYDSNAGRFLSEDLIPFNDSSNSYSYVGNNPPNFVDPTGLQHQTRPADPKYNCMAWGLGIDWKWIQPASGLSPNVVPPQFGCKKLDCGKDVDCKRQQKVKIFEDSGDPDNWHVQRQTCDKGWTSKNGQAPQYDQISDPDAYYRKIYKPSGTVKTTCWSCPTLPPMALPVSPDISYGPPLGKSH